MSKKIDEYVFNEINDKIRDLIEDIAELVDDYCDDIENIDDRDARRLSDLEDIMNYLNKAKRSL